MYGNNKKNHDLVERYLGVPRSPPVMSTTMAVSGDLKEHWTIERHTTLPSVCHSCCDPSFKCAFLPGNSSESESDEDVKTNVQKAVPAVSIGSSARWLPEPFGRALQQWRTAVTVAATAQSTKTDVGVQATPTADAACQVDVEALGCTCRLHEDGDAVCFFICCVQVFVGSFLSLEQSTLVHTGARWSACHHTGVHWSTPQYT